MGDVAAALTWPLTRPLNQPGGHMYVPSMRAQRCLFGPIDHEKLKSKLEEDCKKLFQQDRQRWNFDFEHDRPLPPGRYSWEKVGDPSDDADSNGGSVTQEEEKQKSVKLEQTQITDFMRKRKSSNQKGFSTQRSKMRRRSST